VKSKYCSLQNHKKDCKCFVCKAKRGEFKGESNPNYGNTFKHTKETKSKISKSLQGNKINLGKKWSKERCQEMSKRVSGEGNPRYIDGRTKQPYPKEFRLMKKVIKERDDYTCQYCGITDKEHKKKFNKGLSVHHIDYDKMNCTEENLITLCNKDNLKANKQRPYWNELYWRKVI